MACNGKICVVDASLVDTVVAVVSAGVVWSDLSPLAGCALEYYSATVSLSRKVTSTFVGLITKRKIATLPVDCRVRWAYCVVIWSW